MSQNTLQDAKQYVKAHQKRKRWQQVVTAMACVVVFCTVYALILPAITMEKDPCEIPEHTHTADCYTRVASVQTVVPACNAERLNIHQHTSACYDAGGNLICGYADFVLHQHDAACYDESGALWCTLPEAGPHTHTEACYTVPETHTHTEACYTARRGELICGQEEGEAHTHTDACYAWQNELACGLTEEPAQPQLICGRQEITAHEHTDACYDSAGNLVCGRVQVLAHQHTDACFETVETPADTQTLTCTLPEDEDHTHTALCYGTWELTCGQEEHTHGPACYADPEADVETAEDWEQSFAGAALTGDWRQDVVTLAATQLGYAESTRNYIVAEDGTTLKGYTRYGAWYGSPYEDWCAMFASFCIHYAGAADMPLDSACSSWVEALQQQDPALYRPAQPEAPQDPEQAPEAPYVPASGDLVFFDREQDGTADHVGIVAEYIPAETADAPAQIRTIEGDLSGRVQYAEHMLDDPAILGYGLLPEKTFWCGETGHVHTAACGGAETCPLAEHVHTGLCLLSPEEYAAAVLTFTGPDYTVTVHYGADAALPDGVTLEVSELLPDSAAYQACLQQAQAAMETDENDDKVLFARFFDIHFLLNGETLEPAAPVQVTITYAQPVDTPESAGCQAVHFAADGTEVLDVTTEQQENGSTSFTHMQNGFSVVGNVVTVPAAYNETDVGPDALPVDYYVCIDGEWVCVGSTKTGWYFSGSGDLTDYNRDYITVAQAASILGAYGFTGAEGNPARVTAYQQKTGHTNIYSDTNTVTVTEGSASGQKIIPLSRNGEHAGYNLYYLPANTAAVNGAPSPEKLDKTANGFYTVSVYDGKGVLLESQVVRRGGSFRYDAAASGVTSWLAAYADGATATLAGSTISLSDITSTVTVSPAVGGTVKNHSVTFKVMVDGQWQTVGSLPYYYTGTVGGSDRAYITSAMAAQFFGGYGYTAETAPGKMFGYSYNDIYTLFYANGSTRTNFCMDVDGGKIAEAQTVQLYTSNGSDAQIFRVWDAGSGYSFITPIADSGYHVNAYGYSEDDPSSTPLKLSVATNVNSWWKVDTGDDGRTTFWSAIAPDDQVIDLSQNNMTNGGKLQIWHSTGGARYWYMVQQYRIANDTVSAQNGDGTYNIGLTAESNGDIVCYYLPKEMAKAYDKAAETDIDTKNSCWSVSVRDDAHAVYSEGQLSTMVQYVAPGGEATVTVENAAEVLWSCRGVNGEPVQATATQSGNCTTFTITNITQPVEVMATSADPNFTVQYYANIDRYVLGNSGNLEVIDTSGKKLPQNTGDQTLLRLTLEETGSNTNQNAGNQTALNKVKSEKRLTRMYTDGTYNYEQHPGLAYVDKLWEQSNYKLDAVLVLKDGKSPDSTNDNDWWWYQVNQTTWDNITFTNLASEEKAPRQEGVKQPGDGTYCLLLQEGTVLRLRYETNREDYTNQASFHDYDITSGRNSDGTWRSGITGINLPGNYAANGSGQTFDGKKTANVFAFGNQNCETGLGLAQWSGNNINAHNGTYPVMEDGSKPHLGKDVYKGCTFGLVTGLNSAGNLVWNSSIIAQHLFNDGDANGKHTYNNGSLQFIQQGDTYTLTAANSTVGTRSGLEYFFHPSPAASTTHTHIYTNNFWPMDQATNKTDPLMGAINSSGTCDVKVNGFWDAQNTVGGRHDGVRVPISDDGRAHNWFFGMNFSLSFNLTEDYLGPLEYIFFGDDDMWVFLDNQLICDIGGVHSSVGEYVNLRDYLPNGSSGRHTLTFYYTERGASGSTCWMSFTLPSVTSAATARDTGSLLVSKALEDTEGGDFSQEEYQFKVELLTTENGTPLNRTFSYSLTNSENSTTTYGTIRSGGTLKLHQNETATISGVPAGTYYRVTELTTEGYHTTVNGSEGYIIAGTIEDGKIQNAKFVNKPYYELPHTGAAGTIPYIAGGLALSTGVATFLLYHHRRRRKEDPTSS